MCLGSCVRFADLLRAETTVTGTKTHDSRPKTPAVKLPLKPQSKLARCLTESRVLIGPFQFACGIVDTLHAVAGAVESLPAGVVRLHQRA